MLLLSQYVEPLYARELLADGAGSVGCILKDRVFHGAEFLSMIQCVCRTTSERQWVAT